MIMHITPTYLETVDVPLLRGRGFTAADSPEAPRVILVNQTLARTLAPEGDPLGGRHPSEQDRHFEDARMAYFELIQTSPGSKYVPSAYFAFGELFYAENTIMVFGDAKGVISEIATALKEGEQQAAA